MDTFFTSDMHFDHANIIDYCNRPFESVTVMNEKLVRYWNDLVAPEDMVYVLGDACMGRIEKSLQYIPRLNGRKILRPGNHDRCWAGHGEKAQKWVEIYEAAGFEITYDMFVQFDDYAWRIDHFPYYGDHTTDERYAEYRPVDEGEWLLCGHIHDMWRQQDRMINVGMDVWDYRPVPASKLTELRDAYDY